MPEPTTARRVCRAPNTPNIDQSRASLAPFRVSARARSVTDVDHGSPGRDGDANRSAATASRGLHLPAVGRSAAFFDLDKTVIAKSSALAFGRPFYRDGLISRRDVVKSAYAQLMFRLGGTDEQTMARTRDYLADLCKGWRVEQVQQIVAE